MKKSALFIFLIAICACIACKKKSDNPTPSLISPIQVSTFAGSGNRGNINGIGNTASFYTPGGVAVDNQGNIYVADTGNNLIRKITPNKVVTTLAGCNIAGYEDGIGAAVYFNLPVDIALDDSGNIYVADANNNAIRKINPTGVVTTLAGSKASGNIDGIGVAARFNSPSGIALDISGNIYVADQSNNSIRKITPNGLVTTLAGGGPLVSGNSDGTGTAASFNGPEGVATDAFGNVYVADSYNNIIRKITPSGLVSTLAGSGIVGKINGIGAAASFGNPADVAVDDSGNVYVADFLNDQIRKITPSKVVSTIAGSGVRGSTNGNGPTASFFGPQGIAIDLSGNLYVADCTNNLVRKITIK